MPWIRRGYDPRYDPYYYGRRPAGSSCLRDACLLETGCCIAEGLDGNCLTLGFLQLPSLLFAGTAALLAGRTERRPARRSRSADAMLAAIHIYQREISAHRPACCRFTPSCSQYAAEAIDHHGATRGVVLAARRLLRCRPGGLRGTDPVPA
jgi:putative membrane protein insertion efficiency factor